MSRRLPRDIPFVYQHCAHNQCILCCIGWKRRRRDDYSVLSSADALAKTGCVSCSSSISPLAALDGRENAATATMRYPTQTRSRRLDVRAARRWGIFRGGSWLGWVSSDCRSECCLGKGREERPTPAVIEMTRLEELFRKQSGFSFCKLTAQSEH